MTAPHASAIQVVVLTALCVLVMYWVVREIAKALPLKDRTFDRRRYDVDGIGRGTQPTNPTKLN